MSKLTVQKKYEEFLHSFFDRDGYQEKQVNNFWLIKHWEGNLNKFVVYLYTDETYKNYKRGQAQYKELQEQSDFIKEISS